MESLENDMKNLIIDLIEFAGNHWVDFCNFMEEKGFEDDDELERDCEKLENIFNK